MYLHWVAWLVNWVIVFVHLSVCTHTHTCTYMCLSVFVIQELMDLRLPSCSLCSEDNPEFVILPSVRISGLPLHAQFSTTYIFLNVNFTPSGYRLHWHWSFEWKLEEPSWCSSFGFAHHRPTCTHMLSGILLFSNSRGKKKRWENILNYAGNYSYSTYIVPLLCCIIYNLIPKSFSIEIKSLS